MELFVRYLLIFIVPVIQFALVVWRVQLKIKIRLVYIAILAFIFGIAACAVAASIFPELLSPCMGCSSDYGTHGVTVFSLGFFADTVLNVIFTLLGLLEYKAALKKAAIRAHRNSANHM